jgi:hypothetical protein
VRVARPRRASTVPPDDLAPFDERDGVGAVLDDRRTAPRLQACASFKVHVRRVERADSRDERADLDHVANGSNGGDVRERPKHSAAPLDHDDAGTVSAPADDSVRIGDRGDHGAVLGREHVRPHGSHEIDASVPARPVAALREPASAHRS